MKCFYHPTIDAIATCKNCSRGMCMDCAADIGKGMACKGKCEEAAKDMMNLIQHNIAAYKNLAHQRKTNGIYFGAAGIAFVICGLLSTYGAAFFLFGTILILLAINFFSGAQKSKIQK